MDHNNPFAAPQSDPMVEALSRPSKVLPGVIVGAIIGAGIQTVIQMMIMLKPTRITSIDDQYFIISGSPVMAEKIFWSIVVGSVCAILGSIVGALLDTLYATKMDRTAGADIVNILEGSGSAHQQSV